MYIYIVVCEYVYILSEEDAELGELGEVGAVGGVDGVVMGKWLVV